MRGARSLACRGPVRRPHSYARAVLLSSARIGGWRYRYEDDELEELVLLPEEGTSYVFFNNNVMTEDAIRFQRVLSGKW
jgi:uncharacterized protein YecE (DUF72 family)